MRFVQFLFFRHALEHCTMDRDKLCDTMIALAKSNALDKEMFQMLMVAYTNPNI